MPYKSVNEILNAIKDKKVSAVELTNYYLDKIKINDEILNSFITVTEDFALNQAKKIDKDIVLLCHLTLKKMLKVKN